MHCQLFKQLRNAFAFLALVPLLGIAGPGITPARTEINLGPIPIDLYTSSSPHLPNTFSDCPATWTIRQCVKRSLTNNSADLEYSPNNYVRQGVTGVRFMFAIGGGYYSTPFPNWKTDTSNIPAATWVANMDALLADLASYGIQRVTPTPVVREGWSGDKADMIVECPHGSPHGAPYGCTVNLPSGVNPGLGTGNLPVRFFPWSPYGYVHTALCGYLPGSPPSGSSLCPGDKDGSEDGAFDNNAYYAAAQNPYFTGSGPGKWGGWPSS